MASNLIEILHLSPDFWQRMLVFIKMWFMEDALAGQIQGEKQDYYRSAEYVRRKKNFFKRKDGRNYANVGNRSVVSNYTTSVNMLLTGEMFHGLHYDRPISKNGIISGAVYAFSPKDEKKILGNLIPYERVVNTLNAKNREKVIKVIEEQISSNIAEVVKDKLVININY